eukprot:1122545-Amphidinium_carterae.1
MNARIVRGQPDFNSASRFEAKAVWSSQNSFQALCRFAWITCFAQFAFGYEKGCRTSGSHGDSLGWCCSWLILFFASGCCMAVTVLDCWELDR